MANVIIRFIFLNLWKVEFRVPVIIDCWMNFEANSLHRKSSRLYARLQFICWKCYAKSKLVYLVPTDQFLSHWETNFPFHLPIWVHSVIRKMLREFRFLVHVLLFSVVFPWFLESYLCLHLVLGWTFVGIRPVSSAVSVPNSLSTSSTSTRTAESTAEDTTLKPWNRDAWHVTR